jgi:hypothetical protein
MKQIQPIIVIASIANVLTLVMYGYVTQPSGSGQAFIFLIFWMPAIWLAAMIAIFILAVRRIKLLFQPGLIKWAFFLTLIFSTPLPVMAIFHLLHPTPETRSFYSETRMIHGKVYINEYWENTSSKKKIIYKRFIADSAQEAKYASQSYKKDSTWVYFDDNGDTLKLENYKDDSLISTQSFRKNGPSSKLTP